MGNAEFHGIEAPALPSLDQLLPAEPLLLMGAGPVPVAVEVARAGGMVINHLGPTMDRLVEHIKQLASYAFQTADEHILGIGGPGVGGDGNGDGQSAVAGSPRLGAAKRLV